MKKLLILLILLFALPAYAQQCSEENPYPQVARLGMGLGGGVPVVAASACTQRFTDAFGRGDSTTIGGGWTELGGDWELSSGTLKCVATDSYLASGTAYTTATQYLRVTLTTLVGGKNTSVLLRGDVTDGDPMYTVFVDTGGTYWKDNGGLIESSVAVTWNNGDFIGVLVKGTGNDTVVSVWENPTNTVPYSGGGACTDTAKPCWDNAGDVPDIQFTNNPTAPANTQLGHGLHAQAANMYFDDFYAGDCSD